jgi:tRNA(adenine34) deaminase
MDEKFMRLAIEQARQAKAAGDHPFGAVVIMNGEVVAEGRSEEVSRKSVVRHAELQAVDRASHKLGRKQLNDCVIYASGEPCNMCASAIFQAKIPRVVIAATRAEIGPYMRMRHIRIFELAKDLQYEPEVTTGILKEESVALFRDLEIRN